jgi:hypothetical protein
LIGPSHRSNALCRDWGRDLTIHVCTCTNKIRLVRREGLYFVLSYSTADIYLLDYIESNMFSSIVLFAFGIIASVNGFYSSSDDVIQLDPSNFDRLVVQSSDLWIVEFYAPWCGRKYLFVNDSLFN